MSILNDGPPEVVGGRAVNPYAPESLEVRARALVAGGVLADNLAVRVRHMKGGTLGPVVLTRLLYCEYDEASVVRQLRPGKYRAELVCIVGEPGIKGTYDFDVPDGCGIEPPADGGVSMVTVLREQVRAMGDQIRAAEDRYARIMEKMLDRPQAPDMHAQFQQFLDTLGSVEQRLASSIPAPAAPAPAPAVVPTDWPGLLGQLLNQIRAAPGVAGAPQPVQPAEPSRAAAPAPDLGSLVAQVLLIGARAADADAPDRYARTVVDLFVSAGQRVESVLGAYPVAGSLSDHLCAQIPALAPVRAFVARVEDAIRSRFAGPGPVSAAAVTGVNGHAG